MTPDKNFRMKKSVKTCLALMHGNRENRNGWKYMFIEAQLQEEAARRAALKSKEHEKFSGNKARGAVAPD